MFSGITPRVSQLSRGTKGQQCGFIRLCSEWHRSSRMKLVIAWNQRHRWHELSGCLCLTADNSRAEQDSRYQESSGSDADLNPLVLTRFMLTNDQIHSSIFSSALNLPVWVFWFSHCKSTVMYARPEIQKLYFCPVMNKIKDPNEYQELCPLLTINLW